MTAITTLNMSANQAEMGKVSEMGTFEVRARELLEKVILPVIQDVTKKVSIGSNMLMKIENKRDTATFDVFENLVGYDFQIVSRTIHIAKEYGVCCAFKCRGADRCSYEFWNQSK